MDTYNAANEHLIQNGDLPQGLLTRGDECRIAGTDLRRRFTGYGSRAFGANTYLRVHLSRWVVRMTVEIKPRVAVVLYSYVNVDFHGSVRKRHTTTTGSGETGGCSQIR